MLSSRGVPSFQSFSNPKRAFVNDARIVIDFDDSKPVLYSF